MKIPKEAYQTVIYLMGEIMQYHHENAGDISDLEYSDEIYSELRSIYDHSRIKQKSSFYEFSQFVNKSVVNFSDYSDLGVRLSGLAHFINRVWEVGFDAARKQLSEKNQEYLQENIFRLELV